MNPFFQYYQNTNFIRFFATHLNQDKVERSAGKELKASEVTMMTKKKKEQIEQQ